MFVPFQRERDTMGRLLSATQAASSTPKHESSHAKMNAYLMNTILVDRDIKYYGFEKRSPSNVKTRSHTSIPKKLLTKPRQTLTAPSYHPNKDFVMKRPSSAIISKEHPVNKTIIKPQRLLNGELPKKRVYSFKFSYPKSTNSYRENQVSDEEIRKLQELTTVENRRKRIKQQLPVLMFVPNAQISSTPEQMHERWNQLAFTKQSIMNRIIKLKS